MTIRRTRAPLALVAGAGLLLAAACGGSDSGYGGGGASPSSGPTTGLKLTMLIGSSGDAETKAVNDATRSWGEKSGNTVTVTPAKDLVQELTQARSSSSW